MEIGVQFPLSWVDSAWYEVIGVNLLNPGRSRQEDQTIDVFGDHKEDLSGEEW